VAYFLGHPVGYFKRLSGGNLRLTIKILNLFCYYSCSKFVYEFYIPKL